MKLNDYAETDFLYINLPEQPSAENREISEGVINAPTWAIRTLAKRSRERSSAGVAKRPWMPPSDVEVMKAAAE